MRASILASLLFLWPRTASADPMFAEYQSFSQQGYTVAEKASTRLPGGARLAVAIYRKDSGQGDRLIAYLVDKDRAKRIFIEPSSAGRLSLSTLHLKGGMPDLLGDGSRILSYTVTLPGVEQQSLVVLRHAGGELQRVGSYPFATWEDMDFDGRPEIISRSRPLGPLFFIRCDSFHTMAPKAFQTRIYGWSGARLLPVSKRYERYFAARIADAERLLGDGSPREEGKFGPYLGDALSMYFDHAEIGRGREGWKKFSGLYEPRLTDPPSVRACFDKVEATLRKNLKIPKDW